MDNKLRVIPKKIDNVVRLLGNQRKSISIKDRGIKKVINSHPEINTKYLLLRSNDDGDANKQRTNRIEHKISINGYLKLIISSQNLHLPLRNNQLKNGTRSKISSLFLQFIHELLGNIIDLFLGNR